MVQLSQPQHRLGTPFPRLLLWCGATEQRSQEQGASTKYSAHIFATIPACCASHCQFCPLWLYCCCRFAAANAASAKEGAAMPGERGRILGIGGIFFKSANQPQMREWYGK